MSDVSPQTSTEFSSETRRVLSPGLAAVGLLAGVYVGSMFPRRLALHFVIGIVWLLTSRAALRSASRHTVTICFAITMMTFGVCNWQLHQPAEDATSVREFCDDGQNFVRLRAQIVTVPAVHESPSDLFSLRRNLPPQTRFRVNATSVVVGEKEQPVAGICQVYVTGDAVGGAGPENALSQGDEVILTGRLMWAISPGNPGEFDFRKYLERQRISGQLFVVDANATEIVCKVSGWSPRYWVSWLRYEARSVIVRNVHPAVQGVALALLLGNRHQLPAELETSFVSSGTMHLLAISGLHVGILCMFLMRTASVLMVPRSSAIAGSLVVCVAFAMVTDLRPSVVRASVFFVVFAAGELSGRRTSVVNILSVTVVIMLTVNPNLAFDTGAWLSFVAVAALGRVTAGVTRDEVNPEAPPDAFTAWEQLRQAFVEHWSWLRDRYMQAMCVLVATAPLVASVFHVISPVGLVVNVLLIPIMLVCLWAGFTTLIVGILLPPAAFIPGTIFSWSLGAMLGAVEWSASVPAGHLYVSDLPIWFIPTYYMTLIVLLFSRSPRVAWPLRTALLLLVSAALLSCSGSTTSPGLRMTVLDIGHGSAAVVEVDDQVLLIDAGSLSRSERTADVVSRFLWNRGYHRLDAILISHADMDHYNAVPGILDRFPVGVVITSQEFLKSKAPSVRAVIRRARQAGIPICQARSGDGCRLGEATFRVLQADMRLLPADTSDNETSLVCSVEFAGRRIVLPGDVEARGLEQIVSQLGSADLLVSPHHGSVNSNTSALAHGVRPQYVVVSARDDHSRSALENVFADSDALEYTSEVGAVESHVTRAGELRMTSFRR